MKRKTNERERSVDYSIGEFRSLLASVRRSADPVSLNSIPPPFLSPRVSNYRRQMAGGPIPPNFKVKKNKFVEEWNGRREITEKTFEAKPEIVLSILLYVVALPYGVYTLTRSEFQNKGDRRYKDCF
jgi:hypothetical protein